MYEKKLTKKRQKNVRWVKIKSTTDTTDDVKKKNVSKCTKCLHFVFADSFPFIVPEEEDNMLVKDGEITDALKNELDMKI